MKPEAIRNIAIVMAIAATVFLSQTGFGLFATSINRIIMVLFVVGIILFAYQYYRERPLQWLVIPEQKRNLIIACAVGIVLLLLFGNALLGPIIGSIGVLLLIVALGVTIVWIISESRRSY